MIKAAIHKKIRTKSFMEDEVTSCIFGEIEKQTPGAIFHFFDELISRSNGLQEFNCQLKDKYRSPAYVKFDFWPSTGPVEPDLVVHFYDEKDDCYLHVLIEVKWGSPLKPPCELVRQWGNRPSTSGDWHHLYLTKDSARGRADLEKSAAIARNGCAECFYTESNNKCTLNNSRHKEIQGFDFQVNYWIRALRCVSWHDVVYSVNTSLSADLGRGVTNFFEKQGVYSFSQYDWKFDDMRLDEVTEDIFYQRPPWFQFLNHPQAGLDYSDDQFYSSSLIMEGT